MIVLRLLFSILTIIALFLSLCAFSPRGKFKDFIGDIIVWYLLIIYPLLMSGISMWLWFATMPEI